MENFSLYDLVGGSKTIDKLVDVFINEIEYRPGMNHLRCLYSDVDMLNYKIRLKEFLSGWLGGPALYTQRHGIPMLRENHRSIPINDVAAEEWMICMKAALDSSVEDPNAKLKLEGALMRMAESLKNI